MITKKEIVQHYIDKLQTEGRNLTKWEEDYLESVAEQFEERGNLSDRQVEILERIYADRT